MTLVGLYSPTDVDREYAAWQANCGPAALAAVLGREVAGVRALFPRYPRLPWANPTHLKAALAAAGVPHRAVRSTPNYGLLFLQIAGPWCDPGVPIAAAYRHTHWIGYAKAETADRAMVYDVNAQEWVTRFEWEAEVMSHILRHTPRATGFWARAAVEVCL